MQKVCESGKMLFVSNHFPISPVCTEFSIICAWVSGNPSSCIQEYNKLVGLFNSSIKLSIESWWLLVIKD